MKRSRFAEEHIIAILNEGGGAEAAEVCRRQGISDAIFYNCKLKHGGLEVSQA